MAALGEILARHDQAEYERARQRLTEAAGGAEKIERFKLIEAWDPMQKQKIWRLDAILKV